jgi:hypothetical protein
VELQKVYNIMTSSFSKAISQVTGTESIKAKISKATQDDEAPTPGYLQEELKKLTNESAACCEIEDVLLARLQIKSSNVKVSQNFHALWCCSLLSSCIVHATHFSGVHSIADFCSGFQLKSLRLVKILCERGSSNFKRDLQVELYNFKGDLIRI